MILGIEYEILRSAVQAFESPVKSSGLDAKLPAQAECQNQIGGKLSAWREIPCNRVFDTVGFQNIDALVYPIPEAVIFLE